VWNLRRVAGSDLSIEPVTVLRLSSLLMVREAVLAGLGVARLPRLLVEQDVVAGRLVHWGTETGPRVEIWALYHSRRLLSAKVRAFLTVLQALQETTEPKPLGG
jgi:DNA-binding transcriptional LysR family regulator